MTTTALLKTHETAMGYTVRLAEVEGGYLISAGGRPICKKSGEPFVYRQLEKALGRFHREVRDVAGMEARVVAAGSWHPIRHCSGGCDLEMRMTDRRYPDGHVDTVADQQERNERVWCVSCGRP